MFLNTQAVVISRRRWREADRFYTLFTKELGRVEVKVRAAAKSTSKLSGHLEPLTVIDALLMKGKYGWQLNNVVIVDKPITSQPLASRMYGAVGTIVKSLIPIEQPEEEIYNDLIILLNYLKSVDDELNCRAGLLRFVWRALALSGNDDIVSIIEGQLDQSSKKLLQSARLGEVLMVNSKNLSQAESYTEIICAERLEARVQLSY